MGKQKEKDEEEEDNRREVAIASSLPLQPNFKPAGVTSQQLSKFRELHRQRLQIKAKSKIHKRPKDRNNKFQADDLNTTDTKEAASNSKLELEDLTVRDLKSHGEGDNPTAQQDNLGVQLAPKKRQKLYWGLDTKERWERKANM